MKSHFIRNYSLALAGLGILGLLLTACGGGGGSGIGNFSGLEDLPSTSEMVSTSPSNTSLTRAAVTGTPPTLSEIAELSEDDEDALFELYWQDMVAEILAYQEDPLSNDQCLNFNNEFWGNPQSEDNVGGMGACQMTQMVGHTFSEVISSGTSLCYMKNLPTLTDGVELGDGIEDPTSLFAQKEQDFVVKVSIKGSSEDEEEQEEELDPNQVNEHVFIKVKGSENVGADTYEVDLWFCRRNDQDEFAINGKETISVNKSTGDFTSQSVNAREDDSNNMSLTAKLKQDENGNFIFDPESDRKVSISSNGTTPEDREFSFKSEVLITAENKIYSKMSDLQTREDEGQDEWKRYAIASFSGDSVQSLRFLEAAITEAENENNGGGFNTAVEYRTNGYYAAPDSELRSIVNDFDFSDDDFYSSEPEIDTSSLAELNCTPEVDFELSMDFGNAAVQEVRDSCDGQRMDGFDFCWGSTIQQAIEDLNNDACNP